MWFSSNWSVIISWLSPPATLTARTGFRSLVTIVGVSVILGRLPGAMQLGWPGQRLNDCNRVPSQTPVSPATTPDQPLGVAATTFPSLSTTRHVVVSWPPPPGPVWPSASSRSAFAPSRIARAEDERSMTHVNQSPTGFGIRWGEQPIQGHILEERIGVIGVAIRHGKLHRLDRHVNRVRRIVAHGLEVEPFEQLERLQQERALRPRTALVHGVSAVGRWSRVPRRE